MDTNLVVQRFASLFDGRHDAYGMEEGGCRRIEPAYVGHEEIIRDHLLGIEPIGVYPMVQNIISLGGQGHLPGDWYVKWGCSDIDVDDLQAAINLQGALRMMGIDSWIERSRSKGYHVWVFMHAFVPAATMRNALLVAHEIAEVPAVEVNPKQESLGENQLGNYVRLPYPGGLLGIAPGRRCILDGLNRPTGLLGFLSMVRTTPEAALSAAAELWVPPAPARVVEIDDEPDEDAAELRFRMGGLTYTIWAKGPALGGDRSTTLFKLACCARDDEFTPAEALLIIRDADARWGKFHDRPDCNLQLYRTIERAYG